MDSSDSSDYHSTQDKKVIAFTFDDGPSEYTKKLLDGIKERNINVTFFTIGNKAQAYSNILKRELAEGNIVGNHTANHLDLTTLSKQDVICEIEKCNQQIERIVGRKPIYFRPPFGYTNENIQSLTNMYTVCWSIDPKDWQFKDVNRIRKIILNEAHDGAMILLHDVYETSVDAALICMDELKKQGYEFVTVDQLFKMRNQNNLNTRKVYYSFAG